MLCEGALARVFAALESGHDQVAAEAARLLTRLWAPAAGRSGSGPWLMPASANGRAATDPATLNTADDNQAAHAAKSAALSQSDR